MKLYIGALLPLLGIFAFLIASSAATEVNDIRLGNDEVNFNRNQRWILQRNRVPKRNTQNSRGKIKLQEKIRKRKRMWDLKNAKRKEHGRARKDWRTGQTENGKKGQLWKAFGGKNGYNTTSCLEKVFAYSRLNVQKASTISRRVKRIKDLDKLQEMKRRKSSSAFNSTTKRLLSALGGDASNPTCRGQPFSSTPTISNTKATFIQDTLVTLLKCEEDIAEKCGNPVTGNTSMLAELETCETLAKNFTSDFGECFKSNKPIEDSCLCTEAISESEVELLKACDVNKEFNAAKDAKDECFAAFSKCKKAEVAAVEGIDTCKDCGKESSLEEGLFLNMHIYIYIPRNNAI